MLAAFACRPATACAATPVDPGRLFVEKAVVCEAGGRVILNALTEDLFPTTSEGEHACSSGRNQREDDSEDLECCATGGWFGDLGVIEAAAGMEEDDAAGRRI